MTSHITTKTFWKCIFFSKLPHYYPFLISSYQTSLASNLATRPHIPPQKLGMENTSDSHLFFLRQDNNDECRMLRKGKPLFQLHEIKEDPIGKNEILYVNKYIHFLTQFCNWVQSELSYKVAESWDAPFSFKTHMLDSHYYRAAFSKISQEAQEAFPFPTSLHSS